MEQDPSWDNLSERFWLCLWELNRRQFKPAQRRAAAQVLALTYGRGKPDLFLPDLDDLAELLGSEPSNLYRVMADLVTKGILGRDDRKKTWWFNDTDLWQVECDDQADPGSAQRAAEAQARILADNPLAPEQGEMFPETTDAEVQAEAVQARGRRAVTGLPRADFPVNLPGGPEAGQPSVKFTPASVKLTVPGVKFTPASVKLTLGASPLDAGARGASEPGNQVKTIPGKPGGLRPPGDRVGPGPKERRLNAEGAALFAEFLDFCGNAGRAACDEKKREQWAGRALHDPLLLERCLREIQAHVREERSSVGNRFGYAKYLWRLWEVPTAVQASPPPAPTEVRAAAVEAATRMHVEAVEVPCHQEPTAEESAASARFMADLQERKQRKARLVGGGDS